MYKKRFFHLIIQSLIALILSASSFINVYADECNAIYSVVNKHGNVYIPCIELEDGTLYQGDLSQIEGADHFLFNLTLDPVTELPLDEKALYDSNTGSLFIPVVEVNLGNKTRYYEVQMDSLSPVDVSMLGVSFVSEIVQISPESEIGDGNNESERGNSSDSSVFGQNVKVGKVAPGQAKKFLHDGAELDIGIGAVDSGVDLGMESLEDSEDGIPPLNPGMVNVTKSKKVHRFLPHGMKFKKKVKIKLPYSKSLLPAHKKESEIKTYYYDDEEGKWMALERVAIDTNKQEITSHTDHFTDMINAVVTVPESPGSKSFNPNEIAGIKAAPPSTGINFIEVPQASNIGDARLSYPIEIPPGRVGMQPQLGVQYNSAGGNGWMGLGWGLSIPSIDIHTGWGVPRYNVIWETEIYMLGGMLTPVVHRDELKPRTAEKIFYNRVEGGFQRIIRHGNSPKNYWWEVIDKNGTKSFYGGDPDSGLASDSVLTDYSGNIFKWALRETRDTNGNNVQYRYVRVDDVGLAQGTVQGYELYIKTIHYTGYDSQPGLYKVTFVRDRELGENRRPDVTISARGAFKQVTADLLRKIEVTYNGTQVRDYRFGYREGEFHKTLLESITQLGEDGSAFNTHTFYYYDDIRHASGNYKDGFGGTEGWNTRIDNLSANLLAKGKASALGGNVSEGIGGHIYIGINIGGDISKDRSIGAKVGYNKSKSKGMVALLDINGDGLPDKVYKDGGIHYRPNQSGPRGGTVFGEERPVHGLSDISKDETRLISVGAEIYFVGFVGFNKNNTRTKQTIYFSDVNGDGLVDLVNNGSVRFNHLNSDGDPTFTDNSVDTPVPVGQGVVDTTDLLENNEQEYQQQIDTFPLLDVLRRWTAPFSGQIAITGNVALIEDTSAERQNYNSADGVRVAIQHNDSELWAEQIAATDYTEKTPTLVDAVTVKKGDVIYFRVQSVFDGAYDQVSWSPEIQYRHVWISPEIEEGIEPLPEPTPNADNEVEFTLDTNNLGVYQYKAANDFVLSGVRGSYVNMPINGTVRAVGELQKVGTTTDDVTLVLLKNNEPIFEQTLIWDEIGVISLEQDVEVSRQDKLELQVHSDSPIDLAQLVWNLDNPLRLFYVESPDVETLTDEQGNPVIKVDMFANYSIYFASNLDLPLVAFVVPETGEYSVESLLALSPELLLLPAEELAKLNDTEIVMTVKRRVAESDTEEEREIELLGKHVITIFDGMVVNGSFTFEANQDDELFIEFSTLDYELLDRLSQIDIGLRLPSGSMVSVDTEFHSVSQPQMIATPYRGWSVFGYNGNRERAEQPILITEDDLTGMALQEAAENLADQEDDLRAKIENGELDENFDPGIPDLIVIPFYPQLSQQRWKSTDKNAWVQAAIISSSRNGLDQIEVLSSSSFAGASAVAKLSKSKQKGVAFGIGAGGINASFGMTKATSRGLLDFMDMNGDRCPDIVSQGRVQFTSLLCALEGSSHPILSDAVRSTKSESMNLGIGGTFPMSKITGSGNDAGSVLQMVSLGVSGGVSKSESDTQYDLMDINGDGLPDRVSFNGGTLQVAFNLGYGFAGVETWGGGDINHRNSKGGSLGGSLGFNTNFYEFGGGISLTQNKNGDKSRSLMDINGDGLLDFVERGNGIRVRLNTGNGFTGPMINWSSGGKTSSTSTSLGGGVYFTFGFSLYPLPLAIVINPGADYSKSMNRPEDSIADIDGDGFPDYLESKKDSHINVRRSQIGRTNLLKSVQRPLGASFEIEYERDGNTYAQPHSKWVMSKVTVHDGHSGDGVDVQVKTYRYEDGFYNRQERDFYGYRTVVEEHRNSQDDSLYRSITRIFHNDSYYNKGLLQLETTTDAQGNKYSESENTYILRNMDTGGELLNLNHLTATVFPELHRTEKRFYEGHPEYGKSTYTINGYDKLGNITYFYDAGDMGSQDDVEADIGYFKDEANYIVGKADSIVVITNGQIVRKREASFDTGTGNLRQIRQYLANGQASVTDIDYDIYGNIERLTGAQNYKNQRYALNYEYDNQVHTHNTKVTDSFGYVSSGSYNLKYGKAENTTDVNNNPMDYTYDKFGRVATITGPYQINSGHKTITFEYHPEAEIPWALTTHIDKYRNGNDPIETVLFVDGLKRVLQTKKDSTIYTNESGGARDVMVVSGHVEYDFLGRAVVQYYPIFESLGQQGVFNTELDTIQPTLITHDVIDRTLTTTIPDGTTTSMAYGFGNDRNSQTQFWTQVTDANGISKESFKDVRGVITAVKEYNESGQEILWTSYEYDPLKQITKVIDDQMNETSVVYDNLGRRTHINSPDMGLTETVYDLASNVRQKITANLRAENKAIVYHYDYNRLNSITYPPRIDDRGQGKEIYPSIDVNYDYGAPGASDNRANRIVTVQDQSGMEELFYGKLGETIKSIKTIASDTQGNSANSPEVYVTEYEYDTWNRLQKMVYPDGEQLTNKYDSGGLLESISGHKAGYNYTYLKRLEYDKFGQRRFVDMGNGVRSNYSYNPLNRRLANLKARNQEKTFQDLVYNYDDVGNILGQSNLAAVSSAKELGGKTNFIYEYDDLYRLTHAEGTFDYQPSKRHSYQLDMEYDSVHNILSKVQHHELTQPSERPIVQKKTSYGWLYDYQGKQPHAPSTIGNRTFSYDANGNQTGWDNMSNSNRRTIVWDEENRIQSIADNGHTMRYKYNASGERVIKSGPQGETAYINQFYVSRNREVGTKHIYAGVSRLVSKMVKNPKTGKNARSSRTRKSSNGNNGNNGAKSGSAESDGQPGNSANANGQSNRGSGNNSGNADGNADKVNNGKAGENGNAYGLSDDHTNRGQDCEQHGSESSNDGLPTHCPENVDTGDGTTDTSDGTVVDTGNDTSNNNSNNNSSNNQNGQPLPYEKDVYYYHPDHLGSSAYVTDANGNIFQHLEYFPFGETFVEQSSNTQRTPYEFTAKELDEETGLYYFGARYYDPQTSVWQSPDPILAEYLPTGDKEHDQNLRGMGGVFNSFNLGLYTYGDLNPLKFIDPDGNEDIDTSKYRTNILKAAYAIKQVEDYNLTMSSSSGGTDKSGKKNTSMEGVNSKTIDGIAALRKNHFKIKKLPKSLSDVQNGKLSDFVELRKGFDGDINITGGTEAGHSSGNNSHANGDKIDLGLNTKLNNYIKDNSHKTETRTNKKGNTETGYRVTGIDGVFWKEGNHWDYSVTD